MKENERMKMERVQQIYMHPLYQQYLKKNEACEEQRVFCKHGMQHFLDVARIAYSMVQERGYPLSKEDIYAAALLHDIGKWKQYEEQIPHEIASVELSKQILEDAEFEIESRERILYAISEHRRGKERDPASSPKEAFAQILYDADKASRSCFLCEAEEQCNWSKEKKNLQIIW